MFMKYWNRSDVIPSEIEQKMLTVYNRLKILGEFCMESQKNQLKEYMENPFELELNASYTLNFLIYIQNIYLNQNKDDFKFPYLSKKITFNESFENNYRKLWKEITESLMGDDPTADIKYFFDKRELFYKELIVEDEDNFEVFKEVYRRFETWWDSVVGKYTIEKSVDKEARSLYSDLSKWFIENKKLPNKRLCIQLIYDECLLTRDAKECHVTIIPILDFSVRYKELLPEILKSME